MAILDTSVTGSFNEDRDENVFIGIDLPIRKSDGVDGYFASTSTTIKAVKNNIKNLILTNKGERYLQPDIGLNLRRFLFEQYTSDVKDAISIEIKDTVNKWLPFVEIKNIDISMSSDDSTIGQNTLKASVLFNIKQNPNTLDSVQVTITTTSEQVDNTNQGGY